MAQNGLNIGLHRPNFVCPLLEYVLQTKPARDWKIPKFTKFVVDTKESTVEHIARYLRMIFFPNSLTKNAFTWLATFAPHSIQYWTQLERLIHEQFYYVL